VNEKYLWPFFGVFLGWVLTTLASGYKERTNRKRLLGNLLTKLIRIERQLNTLILATENIKDIAGSWEKYEPIRKGVVSRHFLEPENVRSDFKASIDGIAPTYPLLAIELEDIYQHLLKNKSANLSSSSKIENAYIQMLSIYEVGLDMSEKELKKMINKIAFKHCWLTYLKIKYIDYNRNKNINKNISFVQKLVEDISNELQNSL
jgi:hypothetical protein